MVSGLTQSEGFALDWSEMVPGRLVTGDCSGHIHLWQPLQDGGWSVGQQPYSAHTGSVEDLQWSPNEASVSPQLVAVSSWL